MEPNPNEGQFIEFEEIRNSIQFDNNTYFTSYLNNIYNDLSLRENEGKKTKYDYDTAKGITKIIFYDYFKIKIFIAEKLFISFDKDNDGYLCLKEFMNGMTKLFLGTFEETAQIIFSIYDYDKDDIINKGDVKVLLSYLPLKSGVDGASDYKNQLNSLAELDDILSITFGKDEASMDFKKFLSVIVTKKSDIYLQLLLFLYHKKPFQMETVNGFKGARRSITLSGTVQSKSDKKVKALVLRIPSPDKKSTFISTEKYLQNLMSVNTGDYGMPSPVIRKKIYTKSCSTTPKSFTPSSGNSPLIKQNTDLKKSPKEMIRMNNVKETSNEISNNIQDFDEILKKEHNTGNFNIEDNLIQLDLDEPLETLEDWVFRVDDGTVKITPTTPLKKFYMVLIGKEISVYRSQSKDDLMTCHHLSGTFIRDGVSIIRDKIKYYSLIIEFSKQVERHFFFRSSSSKEQWLKAIKNAIGSHNFDDHYELLNEIGKGRYGIVKLGIHKESSQKVAVKIIQKSTLTHKEHELVRRELDLMKFFRHPNLVKLLDHYESSEAIYIVMEFLSGGDLIEHLQNRTVQLTEHEAASIIRSIALGVKYLNSYGIVHRDLKPENIMFAFSDDFSSIKIIDFGLTKTLAPGEKLAEGMGTVTYVAPEVLVRKPYNKQIDVWSIGVIMYLLLGGLLPFDDDSLNEEEIAKKVVYADHSFPEEKFGHRSKAAINLIDECLQKDPEKRITIEKVLSHEWLKKNK